MDLALSLIQGVSVGLVEAGSKVIAIGSEWMGVVVGLVPSIFEVVHFQLIDLIIFCSNLLLQQHGLLLHHFQFLVQASLLPAL